METTNKKPFVWHGQESKPSYSNWFNGTFLYGFEKKIFLQDFLKGGSIN